MNIVNLDDAKVDFEGFVARVLSEDEPTVVRTATGESVVVVSLAEFDAWRETAYLLRDPANAAHLRKSLAEAEEGKIAPSELSDQ